jgi:two-component system phosphate regulon sensor histidine kinase PhoR
LRRRIFLKLLAAFLILILAVIFALDLALRRTWEASLRGEIERNLRQKTLLLAQRVDSDRATAIQDLAAQEAQAAGARVTIIDAQGKVLADSEVPPANLADQRDQPEFDAALAGGIGSSTRPSHSLHVPYLYVAAPVSGGAVRLAYSLADLQDTPFADRRILLITFAVALLLAILLAAVGAQLTYRRLQRIVEFAGRMASGDLAARISASAADDIGQVASALDKSARTLEESFVALRTSQRQLETLLNSMEDSVIAIGPDDRVQWANRSMNALMGIRVRIHSPLVETVRDPDFLRTLRGANEARKVVTGRARSIFPGRTFDVTAAPLPDGGAVAVIRDLTEFERVEKTRRDFIANVSHELRTPLTSIQGYTETLLDGSGDSNHSREFLEIIRKNAARMSRLTEDLLTLARVESGEQPFDLQPVLPAELLHEAAESFNEIARSHNAELKVEDVPDLTVNADREAIHQVFSNLIDNALKYGATVKGIRLGARPVGEDTLRPAVEFYVRDFGPGIPSEHLPRLFERFYRVDKARSRESGGTGLGLAIAKHIVLAHGGTIRAESELNHGSTFLFTLPLAPQP